MKTKGMMTALALIGVLGLLSAGEVLAHGPGMSGDRDDMPMMGGGMMGQGYQGQMPMMGYGMGMGPGMMMGPGMGMGYGYGGQMPMMGPGMGPGMMMGPGMGMGPGMMMGPGYGMMGGWGCGGAQALDRDLKADDVKKMMEQRVAWTRNPNLKVGKVTEKDGDTIEAEVVTKDNSLVRKFSVDRHTGRMQPVQ